MSEKSPAEYRAVIGLYEDGRIDLAERDRLLTALGFDPSVADVPAPDSLDDAHEADSGDGAQPEHYELSENECAGKADSAAKSTAEYACEVSADGDENGHEPRKLSEVLNSIGAKINKAFSKAGKKIVDAANSISRGFGGSEAKEKFERKKFDEPFEKLRIGVDYAKGERNSSVSDSAKQSKRVLNQCEEFMSDGAYGALEARLSEKFTGQYEYENGDEKFTLRVLPE